MTDKELERLARAATAGPWTAGSDKGSCWVESSQAGQTVALWDDNISPPTAAEVADARFIAAFNPATALALLERVRKAEAALLCEHGAEREYCAASHNAAVDEAKRSADGSVALLARQVVDTLNNCDHCGAGRPSACAGCQPMLAALREAGIEVEPTGEPIWPYWRLKP